VTGAARERGRAVLVVDDSGYARLRARRFLESLGVETVLEAADGEEALALYFSAWPSLVLLDQIMRGAEGLDVARALSEADPEARIVMLTVLSDPELPARARKAGVAAVIAKDHLEELAPFVRESARG
jgi:two-component system, NarL family, invasion response regulator UvrY